MSYAAKPKRVLTDSEIRAFREDGVVMIKAALEPSRLGMIETGIEEARGNASLPDSDPRERVARQRVEHTQPTKLLTSALVNARAAIRLGLQRSSGH